jgi:hypothetical protein
LIANLLFIFAALLTTTNIMKIIPSALRLLTEKVLEKEDYLQIAFTTGFTFGYVKEIKNQARYNEEVEILLFKACKQKLSNLNEQLTLIEKYYADTVEQQK